MSGTHCEYPARYSHYNQPRAKHLAGRSAVQNHGGVVISYGDTLRVTVFTLSIQSMPFETLCLWLIPSTNQRCSSPPMPGILVWAQFSPWHLCKLKLSTGHHWRLNTSTMSVYYKWLGNPCSSFYEVLNTTIQSEDACHSVTPSRSATVLWCNTALLRANAWFRRMAEHGCHQEWPCPSLHQGRVAHYLASQASAFRHSVSTCKPVYAVGSLWGWIL